MNGKEINIAQNRVNLKGVKNGEATSVAIMLPPSGNFSIKGMAIKLYIWFAKGRKTSAIRKTQIMLFRAAVLNSNR